MYGRINKWVAEAILARTYLNAEVYTGTAHYSDVIPLTQDIINSGNYSLDASYRTPFSVAAGPLDGGESNEVLWAVPYDQVYLGGSNFHMKTLKPELRFVFNMNAQPWGGSAAQPSFIDTYDPDDERLAGHLAHRSPVHGRRRVRVRLRAEHPADPREERVQLRLPGVEVRDLRG